MNNNLKTKTMNNQIEVEINGNKVTLTLTDEQINQLQKAAKKEWWDDIEYPIDSVNERYGYANTWTSREWYIPSQFLVSKLFNGKIFNNIRQAQLAAEYMNLFTEMYNFAQLRNGKDKIDWNDGICIKWYITIKKNALIATCHYEFNSGVFNIAFVKKTHAEEAIEIFGKRIISLFSKLQNY